MDSVEERFKRAIGDCLPALTEVYLLRTRIECAAHLYEVGALKRPDFADELHGIRMQLARLE